MILGPELHCVSKKVPTFILSVTLSNLNGFSKFLHCWKVYEICYQYARENGPARVREISPVSIWKRLEEEASFKFRAKKRSD